MIIVFRLRDEKHYLIGCSTASFGLAGPGVL